LSLWRDQHGTLIVPQQRTHRVGVLSCRPAAMARMRPRNSPSGCPVRPSRAIQRHRVAMPSARRATTADHVHTLTKCGSVRFWIHISYGTTAISTDSLLISASASRLHPTQTFFRSHESADERHVERFVDADRGSVAPAPGHPVRHFPPPPTAAYGNGSVMAHRRSVSRKNSAARWRSPRLRGCICGHATVRGSARAPPLTRASAPHGARAHWTCRAPRSIRLERSTRRSVRKR
jgi:hypothetical protein